MNQKYCRPSTISALAGILLVQGGCSNDEAVSASLTVLNGMKNALTAPNIASVDGTYAASCINRVLNWSVGVADTTPTYPALSVVMNDPDCELTLTAVNVGLADPRDTLPADAPIVLADAYAATPSRFGDPLAFYANAQLSAADFAEDFTLTLLYSDDPDLASRATTAAFAVAVASVAAQSVPAPDYTIDLATLILTADVDNTVVSATGSADLAEVDQDAEEYVVLSGEAGQPGLDLDTYAQIDAAFLTAIDDETTKLFTASIPSADFALGGAVLPEARTLILANVENGVRSYQRFEITFNAPIVTP